MGSTRGFIQVLALAALVSGLMLVQAQSNRGLIEGVVTDPVGAVIPGVGVTITSQGTGVSVSTTTNNTGYYRVVDLVPGQFTARFSVAGFQNLEIKAIEILAGVTRRVDAKLQLGDVNQRIEVTSSALALETAASNFGTSVEDRMAQDLPMAGRDVQTMVYLMPGVTQTGGPPGSGFGFNSQYGTVPDPTHAFGSSVRVNGGQSSANAWYLDGNLNVAALSENMVVSPSPDAISEFRLVGNSFAAENGRTGGGVFSMVLKSGTNQFHGNAYEYLRNDATNARNPFTSIDAKGNLIKERQVRYNNFGATLGGPIIKDKTFFFVSWDFSTLHLFGQRVYSVPSDKMRQGDFSEDVAVQQYGIWDPFSTQGPDAKGIYSRQRLPGTAYPKSWLDPVATYYINSFPQANFNDNPNTSAPRVNGILLGANLLGGVGNTQNTSNISTKIDHSLSPKSKLFAEWLYNPTAYRFNRLPWTGATYPASNVGFNSNLPYDVRNQIIALGHTYVFSPTLINEFRANFSRMFLTTDPTGSLQPELTDMPAVIKIWNSIKVPTDPLGPAPQISVGWAGGSASFGSPAWVNMTQMSEAYTITDNITKILGKHTFKAGFMFRLDHASYGGGYPTRLNMSGNLVNNPSTGQGGGGSLASFELGLVPATGGSWSLGRIWQPYQMWRYYAAFLQDDFRITKDFTLNIGLRWDSFGSFTTRFGPLSNFDFSQVNPATGTKGTVVYYPAGTPIVPRLLGDFAPRFNFAWVPFGNQKWVVRGGYDIFYSNSANALNSPGQGAVNMVGWANSYAWGKSSQPGCGDWSNRCIAWRFSDTTTDKGALTIPPFSPSMPAMTKDPLLGTYLNMVILPASRDPMVQNWNFQIERELPGDLTVSASYVGTHGTHLSSEWGRDMNHVPTATRLQYKNAIDSNVPIQSVYPGDVGNKLQQVWGTAALPLSRLLVPYPFFGPGFQASDAHDGTNIYHSLQARFQKRYSKGLNFLGSYTWSKNIVNAASGTMSARLVDPIHYGARSGFIGGLASATGESGYSSGGFQDVDNLAIDRALSASDMPHVFNFAASYELPVGKGKPLLTGGNRLVNAIVGGWRLTGNFNAQSGVPLAITGPCNQISCRVNVVGDPKFSGDRSRLQQEKQWINPAGFQPVYGTDTTFWKKYSPTDDRAWLWGNSGPRIGSIRSPGFWNVDTSLAKKFSITETKYAEFRWELYNALNHQNLGFPNTGYCLPPGPNGEVDRVRSNSCSFGRITNIQTDPRAMQFALKFIF